MLKITLPKLVERLLPQPQPQPQLPEIKNEATVTVEPDRPPFATLVCYALSPKRNGIIVRSNVDIAFSAFMAKLDMERFFGTKQLTGLDNNGTHLGPVEDAKHIQKWNHPQLKPDERWVAWFNPGNCYWCATPEKNLNQFNYVFKNITIFRSTDLDSDTLTVHFRKNLFALSMDNWNHWERIMDHTYEALKKVGASCCRP